MTTRASASATNWLAIHTGVRVCVVGSRCGCALLANPEFNRQGIETLVAGNDRDPTRINAASGDKVILGTVGTTLGLAIAATVSDDEALRRRLVLQLNCVVVKTRLLVVEFDVTVLIKLTTRWRNTDLERAGRCSVRARW